jgi:formylglycine-generating enzyme
MSGARCCWVMTFCVGLTACGSVADSPMDAGIDADAMVDGPPNDGVDPTVIRSCTGLLASCGVAGNDNCCSSPSITGGTFHRSFDIAGDTRSGTTNFPATIGNFRLDKYEVTVGRFRAFVNAGMGTQSSPPSAGAGAHASIAGSGWEASWNTNLTANKAALIVALKCDSTFQTWTDVPTANDRRPINCLAWYEAMAFCAWDGGYLPTEAEWNYAAAGGAQQRAYPWSNPPDALIIDSTHSSYDDGTGCSGDGVPACTVDDLVFVGNKPTGDGRWGHSDLAGNVFEWNLDWAAPYSSTCVDCANLAPAASREIRGGSFGGDMNSVRTGVRAVLPPSMRNAITGVRCARKLL